MAQIIPLRPRLRPYRWFRRGKRRITLRVTDRRRPKRTRWISQWAMARAAGFAAYSGFTDRAARAGHTHSFVVSNRLLARFVRDVEPLVLNGRIAVEIDGIRLGVTTTRYA